MEYFQWFQDCVRDKGDEEEREWHRSDVSYKLYMYQTIKIIVLHVLYNHIKTFAYLKQYSTILISLQNKVYSRQKRKLLTHSYSIIYDEID